MIGCWTPPLVAMTPLSLSLSKKNCRNCPPGRENQQVGDSSSLLSSWLAWKVASTSSPSSSSMAGDVGEYKSSFSSSVSGPSAIALSKASASPSCEPPAGSGGCSPCPFLGTALSPKPGTSTGRPSNCGMTTSWYGSMFFFSLDWLTIINCFWHSILTIGGGRVSTTLARSHFPLRSLF